MVNETYKLDLAIWQIRILHHALEHYIRRHDVLLHNNEFDVSEMGLLFSDMSKYCRLCEALNDILHNDDNQSFNEDN